MTLEQIKSVVERGETVCWKNRSYVVIKDSLNQWFIKCLDNGHCVGLTGRDEKLADKEEDFFLLA